MHIPDAILDPKTIATTTAIAAGGVGYCLYKLRNALEDKAVALLGVTSACIFAAQMVNFPVGVGTSGHLCGGVLAAVLLGPWAGAVALTLVLINQCLIFGDGGILALGANVTNLALIGVLGGYAIYVPIRRSIGGRSGVAIGAVVASWFSVILSATGCSIELAASEHFAFVPTLQAMLFVHFVIGLGEALITGFCISFLLRTRPEVIAAAGESRGVVVSSFQIILAGLAVGIAVAALLAPFASSSPDGLEWAVEKLGYDGEGAAIIKGLIPDYEFPGIGYVALAVALAGILGTVVVFAIACFVGRSVARRPALEAGKNAA